MDISQKSLQHLLSLIYKTLEDNHSWQKFYDAVAAAVDVHIVHMLGIDKAHGALMYI